MFEYLRRHVRISIVLVLALVNLFVWKAVYAGDRHGELTVAFLNVGQGDAIFIEAPNGVQLLIDAGRNNSVLAELGELMPFYDRSIDLLMATHPDADHIGGFPEIVSRYEIGRFIETGISSDSDLAGALYRRLEEKNVPTYRAMRGDRIELASGVYIDILFPDHGVAGLETNESSIIARLHYGESDVMLTGDAPQKIENYVASLDGEALASDILKVGHHGSRTSTSDIFLSVVQPSYAVISAGESNSYGHPHQEVLGLLRGNGISIIETKEGTVVFSTTGAEWQREKN